MLIKLLLTIEICGLICMRGTRAFVATEKRDLMPANAAVLGSDADQRIELRNYLDQPSEQTFDDHMDDGEEAVLEEEKRTQLQGDEADGDHHSYDEKMADGLEEEYRDEEDEYQDETKRARSGLQYIGIGKRGSGLKYIGIGKRGSGLKYIGIGKRAKGLKYIGIGKRAKGLKYIGIGKRAKGLKYIGIGKRTLKYSDIIDKNDSGLNNNRIGKKAKSGLKYIGIGRRMDGRMNSRSSGLKYIGIGKRECEDCPLSDSLEKMKD